MIDIYSISLLDLLPPNLKEDPDIIAAAKAVDGECSLVTNEVKQCILLPRIDELEGPVLDLLAWQMHVDFYDNTLDDEIKRELIKNSNHLHRTKGTPVAVEKAAEIIFGKAWTEEWFEYGGEPYMFKMNVEATNRGASPEDLRLLDQLIDAYKNKRSWLEIVNVFLTDYGQLYCGSCICSGEEVIIYPWQIQEISTTGKVNIPVKNNTVVESVIIYPREEN